MFWIGVSMLGMRVFMLFVGMYWYDVSFMLKCVCCVMGDSAGNDMGDSEGGNGSGFGVWGLLLLWWWPSMGLSVGLGVWEMIDGCGAGEYIDGSAAEAAHRVCSSSVGEPVSIDEYIEGRFAGAAHCVRSLVVGVVVERSLVVGVVGGRCRRLSGC